MTEVTEGKSSVRHLGRSFELSLELNLECYPGVTSTYAVSWRTASLASKGGF